MSTLVPEEVKARRAEEKEAEDEKARAEEEQHAPLLVVEPRIAPVSAVALQQNLGNAAVMRLMAKQAGGDDDPAGRIVGTGSRALMRAISPAASQMIQRGTPGKAPDPAGAKDEPLSDMVLKHLQAPVDLSLESKGGKSAGLIKLNKVSMKGQIKVSPSKTTDGDATTGPGVGGKSGDGKKGMAVSIATEAKTQLKAKMTEELSKSASDLVKAVTGQDKALKFELFGKAKAEAKAGKSGGKPEFSTKVGYDLGLDTTIFGQAKVTYTLKLTLIGIKAKQGSKGYEFEANAFAVEGSTKVSAKKKDFFTIHDIPFSIEGSIEIGAGLEPNWSQIAMDLAADLGAEAAVMAAIDFAAVTGPPLLAGFVLASGIVMAGEKGALNRNVQEAAIDAHGAATVFAQVMTGSDVPASGPRAQQAHNAAMNQIKTIAKANDMEPDELMTELRKKTGEYGRIYAQSRQQIYGAFDTEVRNTILAWRKEHYILSIWTREEDDLAAAKAVYDPILSK